MSKEDASESVICSGSNMNYRTFKEDESWTSLQSTILACNLSTANTDTDYSEEKKNNNLTTVSEEELYDAPSSDVDETNLLNINIDALSDDDVFFDCSSEINSPFSVNSPVRAKSPFKLRTTGLSSQFITLGQPSSLQIDSTGDSGVEEERTGALLVQLLDDFNDVNVKGHAQSTPKDASKSEYTSSFSSTSSLQGKRLDFSNATKKSPTVNESEKENYFRGQYSRAVSRIPVLKPASPTWSMSPPEIKPQKKKLQRKVAQMKDFFENFSRIGRKTPSKTPAKVIAKKPEPKSVLAKSSRYCHYKSPTYHTQEFCKLKRTSKSHKVTFGSSDGQSLMARNQSQCRYLRPSSCSEFSCDSLTDSTMSQHCRSKSTSDLSNTPETNMSRLKKAMDMNLIGTRSYQRTTLHKKTPGKVSPRASSIMKRKSLGFVSSPVKPVKELRKIFSPNMAGPVNHLRNQSKMYGSSCKAIPRIIVSDK